jgi:DNA polymerase III epsilon subunit-like protein
MIVVDVETTGLDKKIHSIISIGAVDFDDPMNQFHIECRPFNGAQVSQGAMDKNGCNKARLADPNLPTLKEAFLKFVEWLEPTTDKDLAGSNVGFDIGFLEETANRYRIAWGQGHHPIDLNGWYRKSLLERGLPKPEHYNTDTIFRYVGLENELMPHMAMNGAKMEAEAFARFLGINILEEYRHLPIPDYFIGLRERIAVLSRRGEQGANKSTVRG